MPHTIKNCFYQKLTFQNLLQAHLRARKQKTSKTEVIQFEMNLENNLITYCTKCKKALIILGRTVLFL